MDKKLTLKLDKHIIEQAKEYAAVRKKSLSRIIESYLKTLVDRDKKGDDPLDIEISSFVKSMTTGTKIPSEMDYKSEYLKYLEKKHR